MSAVELHTPNTLAMDAIRSRSPAEPATANDSGDRVAVMRAASARWASSSIAQRLTVLRQLRLLVAERQADFVSALAGLPGRTPAESLAAEILPTLDAIRFLERSAKRILRPQRLRAGRPAWLFGTSLTIAREPLGVVLVIAPGNYPLLLAAVPMLQALAAGNGVIVKPAPGGEAAGALLARLAIEAGVPADAIAVLAADPAEAMAVLPEVDHVVFTGSRATGLTIAAAAAEHLVPVTLELSGHDAAFVLPGADLTLTARALRFGLTFNSSATCIAPRRVFVPWAIAGELADRLMNELAGAEVAWSDSQLNRAAALMDDAMRRGASGPLSLRERVRVRVGDASDVNAGKTLVERSTGLIERSQLPAASPHPSPLPEGEGTGRAPVVLTDVPHDADVLRDEAFAPLLAIVPVDSMDDAVRLANLCPMKLGATVFGPPAAAADFAARVDAGCVVINDCIAPTADPRLPFAPRGESGYGVTRGEAGLLAMTRIKAISPHAGTFRPHFDRPRASDAELLQTYIAVAHGRSVIGRVTIGIKLLARLVRRGRGT